MFDAFQVLLHFRYTSLEIRQNTIEYFRFCLEKATIERIKSKESKEAIRSYNNELHPCSLWEMHKLTDKEVYLHKMSKFASIAIVPCDRGLWGDIFCVHWISNWLKSPV